jgi:hypothetical protein
MSIISKLFLIFILAFWINEKVSAAVPKTRISLEYLLDGGFLSHENILSFWLHVLFSLISYLALAYMLLIVQCTLCNVHGWGGGGGFSQK